MSDNWTPEEGRDDEMINENSKLKKLDLQSLIRATKSDVIKSEATKVVGDMVKQYPDWECSNGVCTLQWKPRREKESG